MIDKFKPKLPRLPYHSFPPSIRRQNNHPMFHLRILVAKAEDHQAKTQATSPMVARGLALAASTG